MDFINKLTHRDDNNDEAGVDKKPSPSSSTEQEPVPPPQQQQQQTHGTQAAMAAQEDSEPHKRNFLEQLIAGTGHEAGHAAHAGAGAPLGDDDERLSFFDKLTRKEDREKKMLELVRREAEVKFELDKIAREKKENEGILERIKDHFDGDDAENDATAPPAPPAKKEEEEGDEPSFLDKLTHKQESQQKAAALARREAELRAELARLEHDKHESAGVLARIKQHLAQDEADGRSARARDEDPSFFDKITGRAAEAERRRKEEESKSTLDKMKDRLEEGMGGGKKAEEKEDLLDKSMRFFSSFLAFSFHLCFVPPLCPPPSTPFFHPKDVVVSSAERFLSTTAGYSYSSLVLRHPLTNPYSHRRLPRARPPQGRPERRERAGTAQG